MTKETYLFHFIITKTIKGNIDYLKKELGFKNESHLFDYMLDKMSKNISEIKGIIGDHQSEYAFIDTIDTSRVQKYARLKTNKYKILKKWHNDYNEYGMSSILRDIIKFFYEGVVKYGVEKFIEMISRKLKLKGIRYELWYKTTHLLSYQHKKAVLSTHIIQNLPLYT